MGISQLDSSKPIYIIGDVHGCFDTLCLLIEKLPQKWESQIILTGDLIDRGDKSCEVIDLAISNQFACVLGNHEELMLEYYHKIPNSGRGSVWISNGGYETMESYRRYGGLRKIHEHLEWLAELPRFLEIDLCDEEGRKLFVTHGFGLPYYKTRKKESQALTWSRLKMHNLQKEAKKKYGVFNVFGHDVQKEVLITENFAAIDTGCVYHKTKPNARLSALEYPSKRIFEQVFVSEIPKQTKSRNFIHFFSKTASISKLKFFN
ncbi:metallophosphoesterase family protein [Helicobacter ganmani]|uniref:metallophosphoesterase family protein n=1 Tax=Helicobacter ganmani TaxID=60246 RepID=UPI003A85B87B